jgi:hypothetical protein
VFRGGQSSSKLTTIFTTMKVTIENHRGLLRLRFNDGERRCLPLGVADSPIGRSLALQKKAEIELDWQTRHYDPTLLKYKPRTIGKNATEISAPELFAKFTQYQTKEKGLCRTVVLLAGLAAMRKARQEAQQRKPSDLVFTIPNGKPIDRDNFRSRAWKKVLEAAEVRYHRPYDSRATAVSAALDNGAVPLAVFQATGHSLAVMIKRYSASINKKSVFVNYQSGDYKMSEK